MYNHAKQDHGHHRTLAVMANFGWIAVMWGILIAIWSTAAVPLMPNLTGLPVLATIPPVGFGLNVGHIIRSGTPSCRDHLHCTGVRPRSHRITHDRIPRALLCPYCCSRALVGCDRDGYQFHVHHDVHQAPAREPLGGRSHHHPRRYRGIRRRPCAEYGTGYPWRGSPLDSFALCRILHQVLQRWRQEVQFRSE